MYPKKRFGQESLASSHYNRLEWKSSIERPLATGSMNRRNRKFNQQRRKCIPRTGGRDLRGTSAMQALQNHVGNRGLLWFSLDFAEKIYG